MEQHRISEILQKIGDVKIAVYGDFCLDAYWIMDPRQSEMSVETGLQAEAVDRHYYHRVALQMLWQMSLRSIPVLSR